MSYVLPVLAVIIIGTALVKKINIMTAFADGVKIGLNTLRRILPILLIMLTAIAAFRVSGALELLTKLLSPAAEAAGIPAQTLPLAFLKPFSGSGALAMLEDILTEYGAESLIGKTAAVMCASTETTFYTVSIYLGGLTDKCAKIIFCAVIADIVSFIMAALSVRFFM